MVALTGHADRRCWFRRTAPPSSRRSWRPGSPPPPGGQVDGAQILAERAGGPGLLHQFCQQREQRRVGYLHLGGLVQQQLPGEVGE
jgi:hypothetical protein